MAAEIAEQPQSIARLVAALLAAGEGAAAHPEQAGLDAALKAASRLRFAACGSSHHAAQLGRYACLHLAGLPADVDEAHELLALGPNAWRGVGLCVLLSQSGETQDTLEAVALAEACATPVLALTNAAPSTLAVAARWSWDMLAGKERAVPATKSFVAQGVACIALALRAGQLRGPHLGPEAAAMAAMRARVTGDLHGLAGQVQALLAHLDGPGAAALALAVTAVDAARTPVLLGRGAARAIAHEGALKLREGAYVPAQAFASGEFKHGPMAMLDPSRDMVLGLLDHTPAQSERSRDNLLRLAELGLPLVVVAAGDNPHMAILQRACAKLIVLTTPTCAPLCWPLLAAVVLQRLTLGLAVRRGIDADSPRNLVKSIGVH